MAGLWRGEKGVDVKPKAQGPKTQVYVEHYELQPIDPQTNGPQVLYGLRYHTFIHKPGLDQDVPRPGRLLAVGACHRDRHAHARHSARPDRDGERPGQRRMPTASSSRPRAAAW